jgi:hypothetical protein
MAQPSTCQGYMKEDLHIATESGAAEWLLYFQGRVFFCCCGKSFRCCVSLAARQLIDGCNSRLQPDQASSLSTFLSGISHLFPTNFDKVPQVKNRMQGFLTSSASEVASESMNTSFLSLRPYPPTERTSRVWMVWRDSPTGFQKL